MRIANLDGRLVLQQGTSIDFVHAIDVERASGGRFGPNPQSIYEDWDEFVAWARGPVASTDAVVEVRRDLLRAPVPEPRQVFAIGLNYADHAAEAGMTGGTIPPTFTKFPTCLTGPYATVALPEGNVDWEVELVVVIGRRAHRIGAEQGWNYVAGLTIGQDLSERISQMQPPAPQFSLGKSFPGFGPIGPSVVTPDELPDIDDLAIGCTLDGEVMQEGRTSQMIYGVAELIAHLADVVTLLPGDIIFSGTPSGIGNARTPQRFIAPNQRLVSTIEGLGQIETSFVAGTTAGARGM